MRLALAGRGCWRLLPFLFALQSHCFSAGIYKEGGFVTDPMVQPSATRVGGANYLILCQESQLDATTRSHATKIAPGIFGVPPDDSDGGCRQSGSDSVFYLFHMFPITRRLDPDYAMESLVAPLEGDTIIALHAWKETHIYGIIGRAVVWRVTGEVVRFEGEESKKR